jgi:maltose alpha-D-glucosyltransferase/alpha-amylase
MPKGAPVKRARLADHVMWEEGPDTAARAARTRRDRRAVALFRRAGDGWDEQDEERARNLAGTAVARVRQQANVGVMGVPRQASGSAGHAA